jgi:hypothetical protein
MKRKNMKMRVVDVIPSVKFFKFFLKILQKYMIFDIKNNLKICFLNKYIIFVISIIILNLSLHQELREVLDNPRVLKIFFNGNSFIRVFYKAFRNEINNFR